MLRAGVAVNISLHPGVLNTRLGVSKAVVTEPDEPLQGVLAMSDPLVTADTPDSSARAQRLDAVCDCFEAAWKSARQTRARPQIEQYAGTTSDLENAAVVRELILLDVH